MRRLWESVIPPPAPLYIPLATYQACRRCRPDVQWDAFEKRLEIQIVRADDSKTIVRVHADTPAYPAVCQAIEAATPEDF